MTDLTHNNAIKVLSNGFEDLAWTIAQMDSGLNEGVTKEVWLKFAYKCIENQKQIEASYANCY